MIRGVFACAAGFLSLAVEIPAFANDQSSPPGAEGSGEYSTRVYLTLAPGLSNVGLMGLAGVTVEAWSYQLSARASLASELSLEVSPNESFQEYALLAGKVWRRGSRSFHVAAGIASTESTRRGKHLGQSDDMNGGEEYEELRGDSLGLPMEIGVSWDGRRVGGGLALVGNFNSDLQFMGIVGALRFGKLR